MKYLVLLLLSFPAIAEINEVYLYPQFVHLPTDHMVVQNGRVTVEPYIDHKAQLFVRHMGKRAIHNKVTYNAGKYTGLSVEQDYQFGEKDNADFGTSAAQMKGYAAGCMINTSMFDYKKVQGGGPNCAYQYKWDTALSTAPTPWAMDGDLVVEMKHKIPQYYKPIGHPAAHSIGKNKAVGQSSFGIILEHPNGHVIVFVVNLFDPRGSYKENKSHDTYNTFVSSPLEDGQRFITKGNGSGFTHKTFRDERFFQVRVTKENLQNVIDEVGAPGIPKDYILHSTIWFMEIVGYDKRFNASMGASMRDFKVMNCGGECE